MKQRKKPRVIRKSLLSHRYTSSCASDCNKALDASARAHLGPLFSVNSAFCALSVYFFRLDLLRRANERKIIAGEEKCRKPPGRDKSSQTAAAASWWKGISISRRRP